MADSTQFTDPYRSPEYLIDREGPPTESRGRRPGGLTAICVIAIVVGVLGILLVFMGIVGLVVAMVMQGTLTAGGTTDEARRLAQEMNGQIQALAFRFIVPNMLIYLVDAAVAISLVVGGVKGLKLRPEARRLLLATFCGALIFELLRAPYYLYQQMLVSAIQHEYWPKIFEAQRGPVIFDGEAMASMMSIIGYTMIIIFLFVKGTFYALGATYVTRPKIKQLFDERQRSGV
jgi:hypothetical protein